MAGVFSISWSLDQLPKAGTIQRKLGSEIDAGSANSASLDAKTSESHPRRVQNGAAVWLDSYLEIEHVALAEHPPLEAAIHEIDPHELDSSSATHPNADDSQTGAEPVRVPTAKLPSSADWPTETQPNGSPSRVLLGRLPFVGDATNALIPTVVSDLVGGDVQLSPIVLCGASGTGKSFLARILLQRLVDQRHWPRSAWHICPAVDFCRQVAQALETNSLHRWRIKFDSVEALVVDDLHELAKKTTAQRELRLLIDRFQETGRVLIVTSPQSPLELPDMTASLKSRLVQGVCLNVQPPGSEARAAVLKRAIDHYRLTIDPVAFNQLVLQTSGTVPQLLQAMHRVCFELPTSRNSESQSGHIQIDDVRRALASDTPEPPSIREIAKRVARVRQIRIKDLVSQSRKQAIVRARGIAMLLCRQLTSESLEKIGDYFGGRDHTTVLHACRKTEEDASRDPVLRRLLNEIKSEYNGNVDSNSIVDFGEGQATANSLNAISGSD